MDCCDKLGAVRRNHAVAGRQDREFNRRRRLPGIDLRLAFWYRPKHFMRLPPGRGDAALGMGFFFFRGRTVLVQIFVRDNNVDQALKALKKKMQREGTFREMKRRNHYEKPSEKRAREKAEAVRRARKLARKRAQREGLLPRK
jgi:small subunit ribosomal protein S21